MRCLSSGTSCLRFVRNSGGNFIFLGDRLRHSGSSIDYLVEMDSSTARPHRGRSPHFEDKSLPIRTPVRTQTRKERGESAELPSDPQVFPQVKVRRDVGPAHIAEQLSDRAKRPKSDQWRAEDSLVNGRAAGQDGIKSSETRMGATGGGGGEIHSKLTASREFSSIRYSPRRHSDASASAISRGGRG